MIVFDFFRSLENDAFTIVKASFPEMAASGNNTNRNDFTKALFCIVFYTTTCDVDFLFTLVVKVALKI